MGGDFREKFVFVVLFSNPFRKNSGKVEMEINASNPLPQPFAFDLSFEDPKFGFLSIIV